MDTSNVAHRKFYEIEKPKANSHSKPDNDDVKKNLLRHINENYVGNSALFVSPFGNRRGKWIIISSHEQSKPLD